MFDQLYEPETATPAGAVTLTTLAAPAAVVTSIKAAVLAQFKATEPVLKALVTRYENVAIDCSTPKGLAAAKEARHDLRENGRFVVQRAEKAIKDEVNGLKAVIADEAARLIGIVQPLENQYDAPIKAREQQMADEKAERERKEAERVASHRANIAKLASYVDQLRGKDSATILSAITAIRGIDIIPEQWEEFATGAEAEKAKTLDLLGDLFTGTKTAEDEAAAREAQRIENARVAAELAEAQRVMAAKQAELDAKLAAFAAAEKAEADRIAAAAKAQEDAARAIAEAATRQVAEDEANARAAEAGAALLAEQSDATPIDQLSDDALAAMPSIADAVPAINPPAAVRDVAEVTAQAWAPPTGPVTFAEAEPTTPTSLAALLAHIDEAFTGRFSAHPKPTRDWWGALRRLSDEVRVHAMEA